LSLAAGILFLLANSSPIVAIEAAGARASTSLLGAVLVLLDRGVVGVAVILLVTTFAAPAVELILLAYAASALTLGRRWPGLPLCLRWLGLLHPWAMIEVFMLGVLVSLVKLAGLAHVIPGIGLWSLCGLIVVTTAAHAAFDTHDYWQRLVQFR